MTLGEAATIMHEALERIEKEGFRLDVGQGVSIISIISKDGATTYSVAPLNYKDLSE